MDYLARLLVAALVAFISGLLSTISGGGYGTILTPALVLLGYDLSVAVPCSLISQVASNISIMLAYHRSGITRASLRPEDLRITVLMASCGLAGVVMAFLALVSLPPLAVKVYVGSVVVLVGVLVLLGKSWAGDKRASLARLIAISVVSAFNKCVSGGGYGPLLSGGQVLSGVGVRRALLRTLLAGLVVCIGGTIIYLALGTSIDIALTLSASAGSVAIGPLSAKIVKDASEEKLRKLMGVLITVLGVAMLVKTATSLR